MSIKKYWPIPFFVMLGILCGVLYGFEASPVYEISGSIGIMRPTLPPVSNFMPETQNRWVWIRDGLSMKDMLLQDSLLSDLIQTSNVLKQRLEVFSSIYPKMDREDILSNYINELKKAIKIQYTGGDANIFIFTVTDRDPELAKGIVTLLMAHLKNLYEETMFARNDISLNELYLKTNELKNEIAYKHAESGNALLEGKLRAAYEAGAKLYVENILQNVQSKTLFKVIDKPYIPTHPIWPRWDLLIFFAGLCGLLLGVVFYYIATRLNE